MKRGEAIKCIVDYDLFGLNINGKEGCYLKVDEETKKSLIYFWENGEWAELGGHQFVLINKPGYIPSRNKEFVSSIKTLEYTFVT